MKREEKNGNGKSLPLAAPAFTAHLTALETRLKVDSVLRWYELNPQLLILAGGKIKQDSLLTQS